MAQATDTQLGEIQLAGDLAGDGGAQVGTNPQLTHISGLTPGQYDVADITVDAKGRITAIADATSGSIAALLPTATTTTKGAVSIGENLYVTGGTCEVYAADATDAIAGVVQIGTGIDVDVNGVISTTAGAIDPATTTTLGGVSVPTSGNIDVDGSGNISVPLAGASTVGVASFGSGLAVDVSGEVTLDLPIATDTVLGGVKEGANVTIDGSGVLTVNLGSLPIATTTTLGTVKVPGGDGLSVDGSGTLTFSAPIATTTTLGGVSVPTSGNIDVDGSGNISVPLAENSTPGVVQSADTNNITISSGNLNVGTNIPKKDTANTYTKGNSVASTTLTSGTTVSVDASLSNAFELTLGHNATLANPTNLVAGQTLVFIIKQDGTGNRILSFGTNYKFRGGVVPENTLAAGSTDLLSCVYDGTNLYCSMNRGFA